MKHIEKISSRSWKNIYAGFCIHLRSLNYAVNKDGMYNKQILECIQWMEEHNIGSIERVQTQNVFDYIEYIKSRPNKRRNGTLSPSTITHHIFGLKLLFDYCYNIKVINYTIPFPKVVIPKRTIKDILTIDEIGEIFNVCEHPRDSAMLTVLYGCGLRRAEAHWLDSGDVQVHNRILFVQEGKGRKFRKIPLSNKSVEYLKEYERNYRPQLLKKREVSAIEPAYILNNQGCRMHGDGMYKRLLYLIEKTDNTEIKKKKITPHTLRHSIATHLVDLNVDMSWIQAFLGHSTPDSTHIYTRQRKKYVALY